MEVIVTYVLLIVGFVFIIKGASLLVDGASSLAKHLGVSDLIIGLTVVSLGATSPELMINVFASIYDRPELAISNILGNNLINILLILGLAAFIHPLKISKDVAITEIPLVVLAAVVLGIMSSDALFDTSFQSVLSQIDGLILIVFFIIFLYHILRIAHFKRRASKEFRQLGVSKSLIYVFLGFIGLCVGGQWIVNGATEAAHYFSMSESLMGLTIVAMGTSLPELITTIVAARKKHDGLAVGNIIGSVIFSTFLTLGVTAIIRPVPIQDKDMTSIAMVIVACFLLYLLVLFKDKPVIKRWQGASFVALYLGYVIFLITRG